MVVNSKYHILGHKECQIGYCSYSKRYSPYGLRVCAECKEGVMHIANIDWSDYDFGSGKGEVYFETICDVCGTIDRDPNMDNEIKKIDIEFDRRKASGAQMEARIKAFKGFWNSLPIEFRKEFLNNPDGDISGDINSIIRK